MLFLAACNNDRLCPENVHSPPETLDRFLPTGNRNKIYEKFNGFFDRALTIHD